MITPEEKQNAQLLETRRLRRNAQRRKRIMQQRAVLFMLAIIAVLSAILIIRGRVRTSRETPSDETAVSDGMQLETMPDTVIRIAAVGDIMMDDTLLATAKKADGSYDFSSCFSAVSGLTADADCTIGNLELGFYSEPYGASTSSAPDSLAGTLAAIGFDVLQTANTVSIQGGLSGLQRTIKILDYAGLSHVGTYADAAERTASDGVVLKNVNGITVAFIGYAKGLGGLRLPEDADYAVDLLYEDYDDNFESLDTDSLLASVAAAKAQQPDIIIAMMHWGSESEREVTSEQEKLADLMFRNGVDAIIGSHSHLVGPMEKQTVTTEEGEEKTCFVAYSLGNFFSTQQIDAAGSSLESVVLSLQFTKDGQTGETCLTDVTYTPVYLMQGGEEESSFEILPIRNAIQSGLFTEQEATLSDAISNLRSHTDSDFDSGK